MAGSGKVVVIGAGPAGLTAAWELSRRGAEVVVLEADDTIGGISRTVERDGWRFDIGGHRFFTKVPEVEALWHEILGGEDFRVRPRKSRIFYRGSFFDYPLKPFNALSGLGLLEAVRCVSSYLWVRVNPPKDQSVFEGWVAARFGWRLYRIFFKTYTEKVWGIPATSIQADWAAQRIRNLSLGKAIVTAFGIGRGRRDVASLIEEFHYPRLGPGMMWEVAAARLRERGVEISMRSRVWRIEKKPDGMLRVHFETPEITRTVEAAHVISSMPYGELATVAEPPPPPDVASAAKRLVHRDYLTVALVVPEDCAFPDNWIYVHDPGVAMGRIQNYGAWSREMVKPGYTCLGLDYFVTIGDRLWEMPDGELVEFSRAELIKLGIVAPAKILASFVVRMPKAYPVYDSGYDSRVQTIREWMERELPNVHPVGRNGMHKYNNQDHSMYTAMLTVENLFGASHDIWSVNVEEEYHEEGGTGRSGDARLDRGRLAKDCA